MSETASIAARHFSTLRDLLRYGVSRSNEAELFYGHGTDNAYDETVFLILHTLHLPLDRLEPFFDARLLPEEIERVLNILERRVRERVPAAYLTHEAWLGAFRFYVDERVIVPRSHIAGLLDRGLSVWLPDADRVKRGLDLCTGSGCLAILMAHAFPNAQIDASDISAEALEVARRNVADYGLEERVRLVQSDLFAGLGDERYDLIVSNPPYVTDAEMETLPEEYRREPALALVGGTDGLALVHRILAEAKSRLTRGGILVVEVGAGRDAVEAAYPGVEFTWLETDDVEGEQVFLLERGQLAD